MFVQQHACVFHVPPLICMLLNHKPVCVQNLQPSCQQIAAMLSHCLTHTPTHRHRHTHTQVYPLFVSEIPGTQLLHSTYTTSCVSGLSKRTLTICSLVSPVSDHQQLLSAPIRRVCACVCLCMCVFLVNYLYLYCWSQLVCLIFFCIIFSPFFIFPFCLFYFIYSFLPSLYKSISILKILVILGFRIISNTNTGVKVLNIYFLGHGERHILIITDIALNFSVQKDSCHSI